MFISKVEVLPLTKISLIDGNRDINESHVQKMYDLIAENGFADTIKVVQRGKKYFAVEGQHRLESLRLHKIKEVPCSIIDWLGDDFEEIQSYIIDLNAHNKSWTLYDYVKSWSDKKIPNYVHLRNQMINYQKTLSNGVVATCYDGISRGHSPLKKGNLKFIDVTFSNDLVETLSKLVSKWGKRRLPAQILRHVATILMSSEDKYGLLKAFQFSTNTHLSSTQEPLPDGDESFAYWFENVVLEVYNKY
jgi:hypothetical protein